MYQNRWQARFGLWAIACQPLNETFLVIVGMVRFKSARLLFFFYLSHLFFVPISLFSSLLLDLLRFFKCCFMPAFDLLYFFVLFSLVVALGLLYTSFIIIKYYQVTLYHFTEDVRPLQQCTSFRNSLSSSELLLSCFYFYLLCETPLALCVCVCVYFNHQCLLEKFLKWGICLLYLPTHLPFLMPFISCILPNFHLVFSFYLKNFFNIS